MAGKLQQVGGALCVYAGVRAGCSRRVCIPACRAHYSSPAGLWPGEDVGMRTASLPANMTGTPPGPPTLYIPSTHTFVKARELMMKGCELCPSNEDVWLEAARLQVRCAAAPWLAAGSGLVVQRWRHASGDQAVCVHRYPVSHSLLSSAPLPSQQQTITTPNRRQRTQRPSWHAAWRRCPTASSSGCRLRAWSSQMRPRSACCSGGCLSCLPRSSSKKGTCACLPVHAP